MSLFRQLALPVVASLGLLAATPATAQQQIVITGKKIPPGYEAITRTVKITDLNLGTKAGVEEMEKRVAHAIAKVCPTPGGISPSYEQRDADACLDYARAGAREQMDRAIQSATGEASKPMR